MNVIVDQTHDLFSVWNKPTAKPPAVFVDDPLALSCAAYRSGEYPRLNSVSVTAEDREMAARVRKHFMDKLVIQRLKGQPLSPFREKLGSFLTGNCSLTEDELGLLYTLPHFYHEDIAIQELIDTVQPVEPAQSTKRTAVLKPLKTVDLKRRGGNVRQYWWTDSEQKPYCLYVRTDADHQPLYQSLWELSSITVEAHMFTKPFINTERWFYKLVGMRLVGIAHG